MREFKLNQKCAMRTKDGEKLLGYVYDDKLVIRKKIKYVKVDVGEDILLFPLHRTLFLLESESDYE